MTVNFHTLRGTASQEADYRHVEGAVTFGAGETSGAARVLAIEIRSDAEDEHDEAFEFILSSAVGAQLSGIQTQVITVIGRGGPGRRPTPVARPWTRHLR